MTRLDPFTDDDASISIAGLTIENGTDRVALYGSLDITRDKQGLAQARALQALLDQAVRYLEAAKNLPDALPPPPSPKQVANPFG